MTEPEVIEKLSQFKDKLLKFRDERNVAREELASLQSVLQDKENIISNLNAEKSEIIDRANNIQSNLDKLQGIIDELSEKYNHKEADYNKLKENSYKTIKHLVEDNIEVKEVEIDNLKIKIPELLSEIDKYVTEISSMKETHSNEVLELNKKYDELLRAEPDNKKFISIEQHNSEMEALKESTRKAEDDKQTVLSNTWKAQVETEKELSEKIKELEKLNSRIELLTKDNNELSAIRDSKQLEIDSLSSEVDVLRKEYDSLKRNSENQILHLDNENQRISEGVKLELDRLRENVKSLESVKVELESSNKELLDKINRLETEKASLISLNNAKLDEKESGSLVGMSVDESNITRETKPFKFGVTTYEVIQKASMFIEGLFNGSQNHDTYTELNNPLAVKGYMNLSDKEYEVFMKRLQIVTYNNSPLIYEFDGRWRTNMSKSRMIEYISTVVNNN